MAEERKPKYPYTPQVIYPRDELGREKYLIDELNKISQSLSSINTDGTDGGDVMIPPGSDDCWCIKLCEGDDPYVPKVYECDAYQQAVATIGAEVWPMDDDAGSNIIRAAVDDTKFLGSFGTPTLGNAIDDGLDSCTPGVGGILVASEGWRTNQDGSTAGELITTSNGAIGGTITARSQAFRLVDVDHGTGFTMVSFTVQSGKVQFQFGGDFVNNSSWGAGFTRTLEGAYNLGSGETARPEVITPYLMTWELASTYVTVWLYGGEDFALLDTWTEFSVDHPHPTGDPPADTWPVGVNSSGRRLSIGSTGGTTGHRVVGNNFIYEARTFTQSDIDELADGWARTKIGYEDTTPPNPGDVVFEVGDVLEVSEVDPVTGEATWCPVSGPLSKTVFQATEPTADEWRVGDMWGQGYE